jgi:hypothetical protein
MEHLPSILEALGLIPGTKKEKTKKRKKRRIYMCPL